MPSYREGPGFMGYLFRFLLMLLLLGSVGLAGFAYLGDLSRPAEQRLLPLSFGED